MLYVATGRFSYVIIGLALLAVGAVAPTSSCRTCRCAFRSGSIRLRTPRVRATRSYSHFTRWLTAAWLASASAMAWQTIIPSSESDFIFSAIGEEMGLWAAAPCSSCLCFCRAQPHHGSRAKSDLAAFSATGLTAAISFQAFLIVGGVTRLIP